MKRRKLRITLLFIIVIISSTLTSCNIPTRNLDDRIAIGVAQTNVVQTQTASAKNSADPPSGNAPEAPVPPDPEHPLQSSPEPSQTHTLTLVPTTTFTPTITLTATLSVPMVSVSQNTNCRKGPGQAYKILGALLVGEQAEAVGRSADGQNWIIKNPDGAGECWLWSYYASVSGPTESLPIITPPPQFDWSGNWTSYSGSHPNLSVLPMTVTVTDKKFVAVAGHGGTSTSYVGTISDDYLTVRGTWTAIFSKGSFTIYALGTDQFQGNRDDGLIVDGWCGDRSGSKPPNPCFKP